jgi:HAD superfamily hydrolase (TIGR01450 family)
VWRGPSATITAVPTLICDLDGVVWLARRAIAGAPAAVARLRDAGWRVLFVTNNSSAPTAEVEIWLAEIGIPATGDVRTSAMAAARLLRAGDRVLALTGPGARDAITSVGGVLVDVAPADAVVVGFHRDFAYEGLRRATAAVLGGARLIGTNDDPTYPTPEGPIPGGGAILAAVATASGVDPVVAGKPHAPMAAIVRAELAPGERAVVAGDRASTDGQFARALGVPFALVLTGVTPAAEHISPPPDLVAPNLAALADHLLATDDRVR